MCDSGFFFFSLGEGRHVGIAAMVCGGCGEGKGLGLFLGGGLMSWRFWDGFDEPRDCVVVLLLVAGILYYMGVLGSVCSLLMEIGNGMAGQCRQACVDG